MGGDARTPEVHHAWLGPLWRYGSDHLIGSINIGQAIRRRRDNGGQDAEVLIDVTELVPGPALDHRINRAADCVRCALADLTGIKQQVIDQPPSGWLDHVRSLGLGAPRDCLFVEGFEVTADLVTVVSFDFGDLDMIVVSLDAQGAPISVELHG